MKFALESGASLVPVYGFGHSELWTKLLETRQQPLNAEGSRFSLNGGAVFVFVAFCCYDFIFDFICI